MKKHLLASLLLVCGGTAMAQAQPAAPYAKIVEVDGLVTVTTDNQLSNAVKDMPLTKGGQILTTGSGTATVEFAGGCKVSLPPGQTLLVDDAACKSFLAKAPPAPFITPTMALVGAGSLAALSVATRGNGNAATPATPAVPGGPGVPATPAIPAVPPNPVSGS